MDTKNILVALNVLLLAAVGFLYYKVYSNPKPKTAAVTQVKTESGTVVSAPQQIIAYVDLDSLNEKIDYIRTKRSSLEAEQKAIETEWTNGMRNLEKQRDNFVAKAQSGQVSQQDAEQFQVNLMRQQEQIESRKNNSAQKLADKSVNFMDDIQKNLKEFLNDYNKEKGYTYILTTGTGLDYIVYKDSTLNITQDVIAGMNQRMKGK